MVRTLAMLIALAPGVASANEAPIRAALEVDAAAAGEGHDVIERRVDERGAVVLREAGVLPAASGDDPAIRVSIADAKTENPAYTYRVSIAMEGGWTKEGTCELCTEGELVQVVENAIAEAAEHLPPREVKATAVPPPAASSSAANKKRGDRVPLRATGKAGVGMLVGGVLLTGVGIGLAARPESVKENAPLEKTTTKPPGYALIGVGAAAVVTGVVLLAVDRRRAKRTAVVPTAGPRGAGLVIVGRF